jgi:hypothetical protein
MDMSDKNKRQYSLKELSGKYKRKLKRINKRVLKAQLNREIIKELDKDPVDDLVMSEWITDANYQDYHMFEHDDWLRYLGRTWTLEDELEYCDQVYEDCNFEEEEDKIIKAMEALQDVRDYQQAFIELGSEGRVNKYFKGDINTFVEDFNNALE